MPPVELDVLLSALRTVIHFQTTADNANDLAHASFSVHFIAERGLKYTFSMFFKSSTL